MPIAASTGATLFTYTVTRSTAIGAVLVPWSFAAGTTDAKMAGFDRSKGRRFSLSASSLLAQTARKRGMRTY